MDTLSNKVKFFTQAIRLLVRMTYRVDYTGFEKIPDEGPAVLIANHVSYVDGPIIHTGCNRPVRYVIDQNIYQLPGVNYVMKLAGAIPILPKRESVEAALDQISEALKNGELVCIFPEGRLTYTGSLGRFKPGIEYIIKRDPVPVYPIALHGLWGSVFSRKYLKAKYRWFPRSFKRRYVQAICGEAIAPEEIKVNSLQKIVLAMKYKL